MNTTPKETKVMIVDDHFVARFGLRRLLELDPRYRVIAEASNGSEAVSLFRKCLPDLILMDLRMNGLDGASATHAIRSESPNVRILILSSYNTPTDVLRARRAGANGFVEKEAGATRILHAVGQVATGAELFDEQAVEDKAQVMNSRQVQVLRMLVDGCSNEDIAAKTQLTVGTVRSYVGQVLVKMNVANRAEAIFEGVRRGIARPVPRRAAPDAISRAG
ncbi:MAG: response regulator transcription factor [Deltaproteobacteria bacterium]|nr:response regulator transcription factor [Deltaproteobacteria bacterium]